MQFHNPAILNFLFLLIIPVLVHLFQLQKFIKTPFTNVAFLQKLVQETRKSSRIKKWLILCTRLLLFSAILFAFSQPYLSTKNNLENQHTFIYLDNSLSTNTNGEKGDLLQISAKEIIENASQKDSYTLQTNDDYFEDITYSELKNELLNIKNTSKNLDLNSVLLKINSLKKTKTKTLYKYILISDYQYTYDKKFTNVTPPFTAIKIEATKKDNISIDSVFVSDTNNNNFTVNVIIKNQGDEKKNIPIAIYNNTKLITKQSCSIKKDALKTIPFTIQNKGNFLGKIQITFSDTFSFDNLFYFSINATKKTNVLSIGNETTFLPKIYTKDEFNFTQSMLQNINYNEIQKQQLIVLNELEKIPEILSKSILEFSKKGGNIVVIPNENSDLESYNNFLRNFENSKIGTKILDTLKITDINFSHPLFKNVFQNKVRNFQYPITKSHYPITSKNSSKIISFQNSLPFISMVQKGENKLYLFSSAIQKNNSNFMNSPLIVPVFYNFGKMSFQHSKIYYHIEEENMIDIETNLEKDEILTLSNNISSFIPPQQTFQNKVSITTKEQPTLAGFNYIIRKKDTLQTVAFNTPKKESTLQFLNLTSLKDSNPKMVVSNDISAVFKDLKENNEVHWLWKWFLALAIVSLLLEIFILKFYKP